MALAAAVKTILRGQGLVKLEKMFRDIDPNLTGSTLRTAEIDAVRRQFSGVSIPAARSLARITRDAIAFNSRIMAGSRSKSGLRANIPIAEGVRFDDRNSTAIKYSVQVQIENKDTGQTSWISPNILSNSALTLDDIKRIINERIANRLESSPGLAKMLAATENFVTDIRLVLAIRNH